MENKEKDSRTPKSYKSKSFGMFIKELIVTLIKSFLICTFLIAVLLGLSYSNVLGYIYPGIGFHPFPSKSDSDFQRALQYIQNTSLSDSSVLEKWTTPIKLRYDGKYSEKDIDALKKITESFNSVEGFPGITLVESNENVLLSYVNTGEQFERYKDLYSKDEGTTSFCTHYSKSNAIYRAGIVIYCNGLQGYRNSTVLHEFTHLIGFYNHSDLRDSILNTKGPVACMSPTDLLAFKMYYNPDIYPGATFDTIKDYYSKADITEYQFATDTEKTNEYPLMIKITGWLAAVIMLLAFSPFRKNINFLRQTVYLIAALAVCYLFFNYLINFLPDILTDLIF